MLECLYCGRFYLYERSSATEEYRTEYCSLEHQEIDQKSIKEAGEHAEFVQAQQQEKQKKQTSKVVAGIRLNITE